MKNNKTVIAVSAIAAVIIIGLVGFIIYQNKKNEEAQFASRGTMVVDTRSTTEKIQNKTVFEARNVFFAGMSDAVLPMDGKVGLENLPENAGEGGDFLMKYEVRNNETGELLFTTDLIPPGERVYWTPGEILEEGTYEISFLEMPFYQEETGEFIPLTSGNNVITIKLVDQ